MIKKEVKGVSIELVRGDIANQPDCAVVVNAANAQLRMGGGVAGALHRAAGPGLEKECRPMGPISPGECVITEGHSLPNDYVIHCLGPIYGVNKPSDELLKNCYQNALELAEKEGVQSVAFPAISAGAFGYPIDKAAKVALSTVIESIDRLDSVKTVRFVLYGERAFQVHNDILESLL